MTRPFFTRSNHSVSWWCMLSELPIQYVEFQGRMKPVGGERIIVPRSEIGQVVSRTAQNNEESSLPSYVCRRKLLGSRYTRPRGLGSKQLKRRVELIREMDKQNQPITTLSGLQTQLEQLAMFVSAPR